MIVVAAAQTTELPPYHFPLQLSNTDGTTTVKAGGTPYVQLLQTNVQLGACGLFAVHIHNSDELIYVPPGSGPVGYMVAPPGGQVFSDIVSNDTVITFPKGYPHSVWNPSCSPVQINGMFNILALTNTLLYQVFDNAPKFAFDATYKKRPITNPTKAGYIIHYNKECQCACGLKHGADCNF
jgi:mannose-6-phosphate isomerase-like protein (cupin superfamily)